MTLQTNTSLLHYHLITGLIETGTAPTLQALAKRANLACAEVKTTLKELERSHGCVLHPHTVEPWVVHPFSLSPTLTWVAGAKHGWWAPCMWCALGIAALTDEHVRVHSRLGGESETITIRVRNNTLDSTKFVVHFSLPPRDAWNNVHHYCATVLPFRNAAEAADWSERHNMPFGECVEIERVWALARHWYGGHAKRDWRKWSRSEAQDVFNDVGLNGPFWALGTGEDPY